VFLKQFIWHSFAIESPRWLLTKGKVEKADATMRKMAAANNKKGLPTDWVSMCQCGQVNI